MPGHNIHSQDMSIPGPDLIYRKPRSQGESQEDQVATALRVQEEMFQVWALHSDEGSSLCLNEIELNFLIHGGEACEMIAKSVLA